MTFSDILRNAFYILLIFTLAQPFIMSFKKMYEKTLQPHTKVGYMEIKGVLLDSSSYLKQIKKYFKDPEIRGILMKIEATGGASGTSQVIFHEISEMKKEFPKPLVVVVENVCASGAYWVACAADHIIASPASWVGSIGVVIPYRFKLKQFINHFNIQYEPVKAGDLKNFSNPFVDTTPAEQTMMQDLVNQIYKEFTESVSHRRNKLSTSKINEWANGKVFTGRQAFELGLIDELGSKTEAVTWLKDKALIEGVIEWVKPARPSMFENFFTGQKEDETFDVSSSNMVKLTDALCDKLEQRYFNKVEMSTCS